MKLNVLMALLLGSGRVGCATMNDDYRLSEKSYLLTQSISVAPRMRNWEISAYVQDANTRFRISAYATACQDQAGSLWIESKVSTIPRQEKVVMGQATLADRYFSAICTVGLPIAEMEEDARRGASARSLSPQERSVFLQHLLNRQLPVPSETTCKVVPGTSGNAVTCTNR